MNDQLGFAGGRLTNEHSGPVPRPLFRSESNAFSAHYALFWGQSLQLQGIDNGALYELAATNYDLCFTRDAEFSKRVQSKPEARLKLIHVVIPQTRQDEFVQ